ncbi:hypothetical protein LPJ63_001388 [Coemansia sp. RSA 2711]|nr:hypothetical protein LPJ63_001388 [Coemansia sp. RSA 2711]
MPSRLVQVLRLPVLPPPPGPSAATSTHSQTLPPAGLNLVFPACPSCAHKATLQQLGWTCTHCGLEICASDVCWTYRLRFSAATAENAEISASVLGAAAEPWFGCSAAEWVDEVDRGLRVLAQCRRQAVDAELVELMSERMFAMVALASGIAGQYVVLDLRWTGPQGRGRRSAQYSVTHIQPAGGADDKSGSVHFLSLWKCVVREAIGLAVADNEELLSDDSEVRQLFESLEADIGLLRISDALEAPHDMTETLLDDAHADPHCEQPVDSRAVLLAWDSLADSLSALSQPRAIGAVAEADTASMDFADSQIDEILNNSSQLFAFDSTFPTGLDIDDEASLSVHLLEQSFHDEQMHSLLLDSQQELVSESQLCFDGESMFGSFNDSLSFLSEIVAEPLPFTPHASTPRANSRSSCWSLRSQRPPFVHTDQSPGLRYGSQSENRDLLVLAEETPVGRGAGTKRKLEFFVPETPLASRSAANRPLDVPRWNRSASADTVQAVPETPAASKHVLRDRSSAVKLPLGRYQPLQMASHSLEPQDARRSRPLVKMPSETSSGPRINPLKLQRSTSCSENSTGA